MKKLTSINFQSNPEPSKSLELQKYRAAIINNVFTNGLLPGITLSDSNFPFIGSIAKASRMVEVTYLLADGSNFHKCLYSGSSSVLPVLCERPEDESLYRAIDYGYQPGSYLAEKASRRVFSSIICMIPYKEVYQGVIPKDMPLNRKFYVVPPQDIAYVLMPHEICSNPYIDDSYFEPRIVRVESATRVKLGKFEEEVLVPNFEEIMRIILEQEPNNYFLHGVKLPTEADLVR